MIDLMWLRQSYEQHEIAEIRWIDGESNPADAITKNRPCHALKDLIETNKLRMNVGGWVPTVNHAQGKGKKGAPRLTLLRSRGRIRGHGRNTRRSGRRGG